MAGSGRPSGAGRSGPRPMVALGCVSHVVGSPTGSLGVRERTTRPAGAPARPVPSAGERTFTFPISHVHAGTSCLPRRVKRSAGGLRSAPSECQLPTSKIGDDGPRHDPDRTDHRHRATGHGCRDRPLPGLDVSGGRSSTRVDDPSSGDRARTGLDVQRRDRGRTPGDACFGHCRDDDPVSHRQRGGDGLRLDPRSMGRPPQQVRRCRRTQRHGTHLRRDQRDDRGGRGHRPHLVPDPRGTRLPSQRPVRPVRRHRRPDRHRRGRPAAHHRRLPRQPGREGRAGRRRRDRRGRRQADDGPHDRRRRHLGARRSRFLGGGHGPPGRRRARSARSR